MSPEWVTLIQGVGFPAAVAFFVLWRVEKTLHEILAAIQQLTMAMYRERLHENTPGAPGARLPGTP